MFFSWKAFQSYYNPKPDLTKSFYSRPGAINWTAIRSGYIVGDKTFIFPIFYNRIMELANKIEQARSLTLDLSYTMDEDPEFVDIFNPNLLVYATYILADLPLAFLTTLTWYFVLKINESKGWDYKYIFLAGLFSGLALFTKPVALLMIFSFLLSILLIRGFSKKF